MSCINNYVGNQGNLKKVIGSIFGFAWSLSWKMIVFHMEMDKISNKLSFSLNEIMF